MSVIKAAEFYISLGWKVVPLAPGTKLVPGSKDGPKWQDLNFTPDMFGDKDNIGLKSTGGLVAVDVDCAEAVACADAFLPDTPAIYGRKSKLRSKRWYRAHFEKIVALKDQSLELKGKETTLIEIRVNHQDMAPPSIHPSGEIIVWEAGTPPVTDLIPEVKPESLLRAVRLIATTALVSRYYNPEGARHDWALALFGTFRGLGITEAESEKIITCAAKWAGDNKLHDRQTELRGTYAHSDEDPITGAKTLKDLSRKSDTFVKSLGKVWGGAAAGGGGWVMDKKGETILANCQENIQKAVDKLKVKLSWDSFAGRPHITYGKYSGVMEDKWVNKLWLEIERVFHFRASKDYFYDVVKDVASNNPFHPVRDYLDTLTWDGVPRLDTWLITAARVKDTPYTRAVSALPLIAAVRRVRHPGAKFDEMLILESATQGLNKSTGIATLCPNEDWFSDDLPLDVDSKQLIERTQGKWIIEASDLSGMPKSQVEHLKALLSRRTDGPVRLAYERMPVNAPRQFIIVGTTNSYSYLTDSTGNRRFWPLRIEEMNVSWLRENRDQLWAEASARETKGESIRLDQALWGAAGKQQEARRNGDPWEDLLTAMYDGDYYRLTPDDVWEVVGVPRERRDERGARRIATALQNLGFKRMTVRDENKKVTKGWGKGSRVYETINEGPETWAEASNAPKEDM